MLERRLRSSSGKYLASLGGCMDCHTPGYFFGKPEMPRHLAGSEVGFEIPGLGIFYGANLTPDKETGLGALGRMKKSWRQCKKRSPGRAHAGADHAFGACLPI